MTDAISKTPLLAVRDLRVARQTETGEAEIVTGVDLTLNEGEVLGIVGESGCGKSVSMLSLLGILPPALRVSSGSALFEGEDLFAQKETRLAQLRGSRIGFVFQDPMTSLNPVMTIGAQLSEPLRYHAGLGRKEAWAEAGRLLTLVGIAGGESRLSNYPHQLSGGMRQRVMIAMSIACRPSLLIADEPTTALDVTTQAQIVDLIFDIRRQFGLSVIWVSHDLALLSQIADRIAVFYSGRIVEEGTAEQICSAPVHPYTQALISSMPVANRGEGRRLKTIDGLPPDPARRPVGCAFAPRCERREERCLIEPPALLPMDGARQAACFVAHDDARELAR
jgi:peptide/nickel transport system ATP-binding protein